MLASQEPIPWNRFEVVISRLAVYSPIWMCVGFLAGNPGRCALNALNQRRASSDIHLLLEVTRAWLDVTNPDKSHSSWPDKIDRPIGLPKYRQGHFHLLYLCDVCEMRWNSRRPATHVRPRTQLDILFRTNLTRCCAAVDIVSDCSFAIDLWARPGRCAYRF